MSRCTLPLPLPQTHPHLRLLIRPKVREHQSQSYRQQWQDRTHTRRGRQSQTNRHTRISFSGLVLVREGTSCGTDQKRSTCMPYRSIFDRSGIPSLSDRFWCRHSRKSSQDRQGTEYWQAERVEFSHNCHHSPRARTRDRLHFSLCIYTCSAGQLPFYSHSVRMQHKCFS